MPRRVYIQHRITFAGGRGGGLSQNNIMIISLFARKNKTSYNSNTHTQLCIFLATTMRPMDKVTYGIVITCRALCSFEHDQVDVQKHTFSLKQVEKAQPNSQRNVKSSLTHLLCKQDGTTKVKNLDCHQFNAHHLKFINTEIKYISI